MLPFQQMHIQFVESMLGVHKKYKELIQEVFNSDQSFMGALDKACSSVINHRMNPKQPCRSPELVNNQISQTILLFCCVNTSKLMLLFPFSLVSKIL